METIYVSLATSEVRLRKGQLQVRVGGVVRQQVALRDLARVVLFGPVTLSPPALRELLERGVSVVCLSTQGRLQGRYVALESGDVEIRLAQYRAATTPGLALRLARSMVVAKLRNTRRLLGRQMADHPDPGLVSRREKLSHALAMATIAPSLATLRGQEGRGAAAWFAAFGQLLRGELTFTRRRRHPPPDPVNALLSLGYGLLSAEMAGAAAAVGLDPWLGLLHQPRRGRLSLVQDLIEEFRAPAVDRLVLQLVNRRRLTPGDFQPEPTGGLRLTPAAFRLTLTAWEEHLNRPFQQDGRPLTLRRAFHRQALRLEHALRTETEYVGFRMP